MPGSGRSVRPRPAAYWIATALVSTELALGGAADVLRIPYVTHVIEHLGYPQYFLVVIGVWKLLGAVALVVPRFPRLKEWAYLCRRGLQLHGRHRAHLAVGNGILVLVYPAFQIGLVWASWALRPPPRRDPRPTELPLAGVRRVAKREVGAAGRTPHGCTVLDGPGPRSGK